MRNDMATKKIPKPNAEERTFGADGTESPERKAVGVDPGIKASNLRRLRRIEGQIRGLHRMVEEDRYCADILMQVSSTQEALRAVSRALMRNHLAHCAAQAIRTGSAEERRTMYDELLEMIYKNAR
jgi:CsoR family transcriptional regulator, copper-sensing transcriptional repressor